MFDLPLHPVLVHFPIVFSVLFPLIALAAFGFGFRTGKTRKFWAAVVVVHSLLFVSSFLAVQTGEKDEEKVEEVLADEAPLEAHEEKAELFLKVTGAALAVTALGLAPGFLGQSARALGGAVSLAILFLGYQVGHTGGQLVYRHGAAAAHSAAAAYGSGEKAAAGFGHESTAGDSAQTEVRKENLRARDEGGEDRD